MLKMFNWMTLAVFGAIDRVAPDSRLAKLADDLDGGVYALRMRLIRAKEYRRWKRLPKVVREGRLR